MSRPLFSFIGIDLHQGNCRLSSRCFNALHTATQCNDFTLSSNVFSVGHVSLGEEEVHAYVSVLYSPIDVFTLM